jgi:GrpB-like predicted nucleotidyltransferase (UPF0157 family)
MIGLNRRTVEVVSYDPTWMMLAVDACQAVRSACGELIVDLQHLGSTAVPDLPAKPILDIAADVADDTSSNRAGSIGVPFVDFIGRCFLRACLWMELLESWKREKQALPDERIESAASWRYQ